MKYKKKPVIVEAEQWFPGKAINGVFGERDADEGGNGLSPEPAMAWVRTPDGTVNVLAGDWIITGPEGVFRCRADIFAATYEPA